MLRNGVMPIPPARNTAARVKPSGRVKSPDGPSIFTAAPSGIVLNTCLNAVSRIRVATIRVSSLGPLAIEKLRTLPSESVSGGSSKVMSRYWPALNAQLVGRSKRKAIVPSAISCRLKRLAVVIGGVATTVICSFSSSMSILWAILLDVDVDGQVSFRHPRYKPRESYPRLLAEILIVFPPSALALADVCVAVNEFDRANVFDHRETELCLHAQAERGSVVDRERLAIHF